MVLWRWRFLFPLLRLLLGSRVLVSGCPTKALVHVGGDKVSIKDLPHAPRHCHAKLSMLIAIKMDPVEVTRRDDWCRV